MDQLNERTDALSAPLQGDQEDGELGEQSSSLSNLGAKLTSMFIEFRDDRRDIENEWLRDLRQYNAEYDPEVKQKLNPNRSQVFVGLTRTKVTSAYSRMVDLYFQRGERFFGIDPTPVPEIDPARELEIKRQAMLEIAEVAGGQLYPDLVASRRMEIRKEIQNEINEDARLAAAEMELEIEDQLTEANVEQMLKESIMELCIFGAGAMKGGGTRVDKRKRYTKVGETWQPIYEEVPKPDFQSCSIFDCFPETPATSMQDCSRFFYRHRPSRAEFRDLGAAPGFDVDRINQIIRDNPTGTYVETDVERERRQIAGFRNESSGDNRYEVLEFWGSLSGEELIEVGVGIDRTEFEAMTEEEKDTLQEEEDEDTPIILLDRDSEYAANVWLASGNIIMARLSPVPDGNIPFYIAPYERVPHQFWGVGIPRMMRDSQVTMNAAIRIFLDNLAISSGPMVEVNTDLLAAGEDPQDIYPWRVFLREGGDPSAKAVQFYQAQTNTSGLAAVIEMFRRFADETTSLPSYTHGQQTDAMNDTATGASMLMNAANVALKSTIKNVDDYLLEPFIRSTYAWNMKWNDKEWIKGDFRIVARGSTALVQKELQSQRLLQFAQIVGANEVTAQLVDWGTLLGDIAKSMDLDPDRVTRIKEVADAQLQANAGGGQGGPVPPGSMPGPMGAAAGPPEQAAREVA